MRFPISMTLLFGLALHAGAARAELFEIGRDDARLSFMGGSGSVGPAADLVGAAHDGSRNRFLVVWNGVEKAGESGFEFGLHARFVDEQGAPLAPSHRVFAGRTFSRPSLVYNATLDEFFVAFDSPGDTRLDALGLRLDAELAQPLGEPVRLQAGDGALGPVAAWNPTANEYLVAWSTAVPVRGTEIVTQRLAAADLAQLGVDDRPVSQVGPDGNSHYSAFEPRVVYNAAADEYLVAFLATPPDGPGQIADHIELFVQRLVGASGEEVGVDDRRISFMGPFDENVSSAGYFDIAVDAGRNRYLALWEGHRVEAGLGPFESELYSQLLDGTTAAEIGADDQRVTAVGGLGDSNQTARSPRLVFDAKADRFVAVGTATFLDDEVFDAEILAVALDPESGAAAEELRIVSRSGGREGTLVGRRAYLGAVAVSLDSGALLAVWHGEDDDSGMVPSEAEAFCQALRADALFVDGFEPGDAMAWDEARPERVRL